MMKKLLVLALLLSCMTKLSAQTIPSERVVLSISPNAKDVSFAVRTDANVPLVCNFGENEGIKTFDAATDGNLTTVTYNFVNPSTNERTIEIAADKLQTLRIVQKKQVNGVLEVKSGALKNLNIDYVNLEKHSKVDVSQCPKLEAITLTSTGVEEIVLPKSEVLKSVQASSNLLGKGSLKKVNNWDAPNLTEIGFVGASIDTLDVRNNIHLTTLACALPAKGKGLRGIKGAKMLKELKMLDVRGNALAFNQIPDKVIVDTPLENFRYSAQGPYLVPKKNINGLTVDLSELLYARGISPTNQETTFEWKYKATEKDPYKPVPSELITVHNGKFTFDPLLVPEDKILRVYCTMTNGGYPDIATKDKHSISTYMIKLTDPTAGISRVTTKDASFTVTTTDNGCRIESAKAQNATVYNVEGKTIWSGKIPATIDLEHGMYIIRSESGNYVKLMR